jgi:GDP-L-fucose synthase
MNFSENSMHKNSKIFVAGGASGMVGRAIVRHLWSRGYEELSYPASEYLDLTSMAQVDEYFGDYKPEYVFLAAAKVGGIHANGAQPAEFIYSNLAIQTNVIHAAKVYGVKKLLLLGSSCIYPRDAEQPIKESALLTGPLEPTNLPYAIAKIAGIKMCEAYNKQYGTNFITCMPTNLYGPGDNYDLQNAHVLPALIRKVHEAKIRQAPTVTVWGSGRPLREFLYVDDLAEACVFLMQNYDGPGTINVGSGEEITIENLAHAVCMVLDYRGRLVFDTSKPDGTPRKLLDSSRIRALGWGHRTKLGAGIRAAYQDFLKGSARNVA